MLREPWARRLTALLWKVATAAVVLGLVFALSSPIISLAESRWQSSSTRPERASGAVDQINEQEAILKVTNNLHYVQRAGARAGSIRNLTAKGILRFSGSYPMFPTPSSLPWGALVNNPREPAAVAFDVINDWETFAADITYIAFVSILQLIPTPTGCMVEPFVKSEQGLVFLIEMSPYFDSVVDNLVAGATQGATAALVAALNLLLQELPSKLGKVGLSCLGDAIKAATIQALPGIGQVITVAMIAVKVTPIILDWIAYPKGLTSIAFAYAPAQPTPTPIPTVTPRPPIPTPVPASRLGPNIIPNPSFESGALNPDSWQRMSPNWAIQAWESGIAHSGRRSLSISGPTLAPDGRPYAVVWATTSKLSLDPSKRYRLSVWAKAGPNYDPRAGAPDIVVFGASGGWGLGTLTSVSKDWQEFVRDNMPIPAATVTVQIQYISNIPSDRNTVYFDDISLRAIE